MSIYTACRDISELCPTAQKACRLFLEKCEEKGLKVLITETYRSQERQNYLYEQGRTRSGKIVTWTKNSRHTSRRAWDICKNKKGEEYSDSNFFKECGKIAKELGITWGGEWKTADTPHFEIDKNWSYEEENVTENEALKQEIEYLKASIDKLGDRITRLENPMIYDYVDENMPSWARNTITKLTGEGVLKGDEEGRLGLTLDNLRLLTILDRANVFGI